MGAAASSSAATVAAAAAAAGGGKAAAAGIPEAGGGSLWGIAGAAAGWLLGEGGGLVRRTANNADWAAWSDRFMYPVEKYMFLFPNDVRAAVHGAQQREGFFPSTHHFLQGVWIALALCALRYLLDHLAFMPLGAAAMRLKYWGKASPLEAAAAAEGKAVPMGIIQRLDADFRRNPLPTRQQLTDLAHATRLPVERVGAYMRHRRRVGRDERRLAKFKEACWRDFLYLSTVLASAVCVLPQPWFHDIQECWRSYPLQAVPEVVVWYYMYQLGIYLHLSAYQFVDTRRSDFWEMFVHHLATIGLIVFSWMSCFIRIGTLVMLIHDPSDVFLETAKIFNYTSRARPWAQAITDNLFVCFALCFFVTRLAVYPFWIVHSTLTHAHYIIGGRFALMHMFYAMLFVLQILHVFWFYLIARMAVRMIISGKVEKDVRSDDEDDEASDEEEEQEEGGDGDKDAVGQGQGRRRLMNGTDASGSGSGSAIGNGNGAVANPQQSNGHRGGSSNGDGHKRKTQ